MQERISKEIVKRPLKQKIILAICVVVFIMDISCVGMNYTNYMNVNQNYTDSLAQTVANTCRLVVDGDKVTDYLASRRRNTSYYEVWNKLIDYCNTSENIMRISVVDFNDMGGVYVFDTDLTEDGAFLGDIRPYDAKQALMHEELVACTEISPIHYGKKSDYYIPLNSSYNIPVAYIIVSISTENVRIEQLQYLLYVIFVVTAITFVFGAFLIWFMHLNVISPINDMAAAAANYSIESLKGDKASPISQMEINTGDELQRLCESMKKMEYDIIASSSQLAVADWNSNHDSMTQLYNKRYYEEALSELKDREDVGIIYLDIDNLKKMNDTYGHEKGDEVIINAANLIRKYTQPGFSSCRIGGDEFVMLIRGCSEETLKTLVEIMKADKAGNLSDTSAEFYCRLAIGGAFRKSGESLIELIKRAEGLMYQNKHSSR